VQYPIVLQAPLLSYLSPPPTVRSGVREIDLKSKNTCKETRKAAKDESDEKQNQDAKREKRRNPLEFPKVAH
jgi:hypothetical protein